MNDPRIDGLARVIVRYSLELQEGQTFFITERRGGRAARAGAVRGDASRRRQSRARPLAGGHAARVLRSRERRPDRLGLAGAEVGVRGGRRADQDPLRHERPRALEGPAREADAPPEGDAPLHAEDDGAERRRRPALERHALPDQRLRGGGRHEPARLRGLLLPRLPLRPAGSRSPPGSRRPPRRSGSPSGRRVTRRSTSRARAPT